MTLEPLYRATFSCSQRWFALTGEVRTLDDGGAELVLDAAEIVWEPLAE